MIRPSGDVFDADGTVDTGNAKKSFPKLEIFRACFKQKACQFPGFFNNLVRRQLQGIAADDSAARGIGASPERDLVSVALE